MMSETNNHRGEVEQQLQDAFSDYSVTADDAVWDNIEAAIQPEKKRRGAFWWFTTGAAAGIAALVFTYTIYQSSSEQPTAPATAGTEVAPNTAVPDQETTPSEAVTSTDATSGEKALEYATAAGSNETEGAVASDETSVTSNAEESIASNENGVPTTSGENRMEAAKALKTPHQQLVAQTMDHRSSTPLFDANAGQKRTTQWTPSPGYVPLLEPLTVDGLPNTSSRTIAYADASWDEHLLPPIIRPRAADDDEWEDWDDASNADQWALAANLGSSGSGSATVPTQDNFEATGNQAPGNFGSVQEGIPIAQDIASKDDGEADYRSPFIIGVRGNVSVSKRVSLESGLNYALLPQTITFDDGGIRDVMRVDQHFIGVPVLVNYAFVQRKRFSMYSSQGLIIEKGIAAFETQTTYQGEDQLSQEKTRGDAPGIQGALTFGLGADYKIGKLLSLYMQPSVSSWLINHQVGRNVRNHQLLWPNLQMGVRFNL